MSECVTVSRERNALKSEYPIIMPSFSMSTRPPMNHERRLISPTTFRPCVHVRVRMESLLALLNPSLDTRHIRMRDFRHVMYSDHASRSSIIGFIDYRFVFQEIKVNSITHTWYSSVVEEELGVRKRIIRIDPDAGRS